MPSSLPPEYATDGWLRRACRIVAVCWAILAALFTLQPDALSPGISFPLDSSAAELEAFWAARPSESVLHVLLHAFAIVTSIATLSVVMPLARRAGGALSEWGGRFAMVGAAAMALSNARFLALEPTYTRLYFEQTHGRSALAVATAQLPLDPFGILEFGGIAVWILVVHRGLAESGFGPLYSRWLGLIAALGLLGMVAGGFGVEWMLTAAPVVGTPCLCGWLLSLSIRRSARTR